MTITARRHPLVPILVGLLLWVAPAPAQAQEPSESATSASLEVESFDRQITRVPVGLTCNAAPAGAAACEVTLQASWSLISARTGERESQPAVFASVPVSVPVGASSPVDLDVSALRLRDKLEVTDGRSAALVTIDVVDRAGALVDLGSVVGYRPPFKPRCHEPRSVSFEGGPVQQRSADGKRFETVVSDRLDTSTDTKVGEKGMRFSLYGVRYVFGPGSRFVVTCSALGSYARGRPFPTVMIRNGKVHVTGKPRGSQYVASIFTPEGSLGSRSKERIDFTVSRKAAARKSIMRVKKGDTTQVTPVAHKNGSPCTNGQALSVDRRGRIRRLG